VQFLTEITVRVGKYGHLLGRCRIPITRARFKGILEKSTLQSFCNLVTRSMVLFLPVLPSMIQPETMKFFEKST